MWGVRARGEGGQAAVESAMVMPLMVFLALGLIQLTLMQQAKLMTEYAAFQAARAGIVWNGHHERMHDAAVVALLPTLGRTDSLLELGNTWSRHQRLDAALSALDMSGAGVPKALNGSNLAGLVRIDTVNPAYFSPIDNLWNLREGLNWKELDFDGPGTFPEVPSLEQKIARFFGLAAPDDSEEVYRRSTLLSIRVRYWYELRVPFANWIIFLSWFASNADVALHGAVDRSTLSRGNMMSRAGGVSGLGALGRGLHHGRGFASVYPAEMQVLWGLATGGTPLFSGGEGRHCFIPLTATYSMRMQSNFHRKWLMHLSPSWEL